MDILLILYARAKKHVTDQGGKITNEFKLVKGFTYDLPNSSGISSRSDLTFSSADMPPDKVSTLQSNEHINFEADGEVTTQ